MPQPPNWVPATDLAYGDEIRFNQVVWDPSKRNVIGHKQIWGSVVHIGPRLVELSTTEGRMKKRLTTIEKGDPQRLERANRKAKVELTRPRLFRRAAMGKRDVVARAVARDDEREKREAKREEEERGRQSQSSPCCSGADGPSGSGAELRAGVLSKLSSK